MQHDLSPPQVLNIDQQVGSKGGIFASEERLLKVIFMLSGDLFCLSFVINLILWSLKHSLPEIGNLRPSPHSDLGIQLSAYA